MTKTCNNSTMWKSYRFTGSAFSGLTLILSLDASFLNWNVSKFILGCLRSCRRNEEIHHSACIPIEKGKISQILEI